MTPPEVVEALRAALQATKILGDARLVILEEHIAQFPNDKEEQDWVWREKNELERLLQSTQTMIEAYKP